MTKLFKHLAYPLPNSMLTLSRTGATLRTPQHWIRERSVINKLDSDYNPWQNCWNTMSPRSPTSMLRLSRTGATLKTPQLWIREKGVTAKLISDCNQWQNCWNTSRSQSPTSMLKFFANERNVKNVSTLNLGAACSIYLCQWLYVFMLKFRFFIVAWT